MADELGPLEKLTKWSRTNDLSLFDRTVVDALVALRADVFALKAEPTPPGGYYDPKGNRGRVILAKPGNRSESTTVKAATERVAAGEDARTVARDYGWDDDALVYVAEEIRQRDEALAESGRLVGILDRAEAEVARMRHVVEAARSLREVLGRVDKYLTPEAEKLCAAVDAYDGK